MNARTCLRGHTHTPIRSQFLRWLGEFLQKTLNLFTIVVQAIPPVDVSSPLWHETPMNGAFSLEQSGEHTEIVEAAAVSWRK